MLSRNIGNRFNGRRRWPLHVRCRRKKFMFAISSCVPYVEIGIKESNGDVRTVTGSS